MIYPIIGISRLVGNAPAAVIGEQWTGKTIQVRLHESGTFNACAAKAPRRVSINGGQTPGGYWLVIPPVSAGPKAMQLFF